MNEPVNADGIDENIRQIEEKIYQHNQQKWEEKVAKQIKDAEIEE
jgi:hypothetical protein